MTIHHRSLSLCIALSAAACLTARVLAGGVPPVQVPGDLQLTIQLGIIVAMDIGSDQVIVATRTPRGIP